MAAPLFFELMMKELNQQLDETDVDENVSNPIDAFVAKRALAHANGSAGVAAFQKIAPSYKPPVDETGGNPWLVKHETVLSQKIENDLDEEISDPHALAKRLGQDSRTALTEWIKKCVDGGDSVEDLAEFAEQNDPAKAELIREIGATL